LRPAWTKWRSQFKKSWPDTQRWVGREFICKKHDRTSEITWDEEGKNIKKPIDVLVPVADNWYSVSLGDLKEFYLRVTFPDCRHMYQISAQFSPERSTRSKEMNIFCLQGAPTLWVRRFCLLRRYLCNTRKESNASFFIWRLSLWRVKGNGKGRNPREGGYKDIRWQGSPICILEHLTWIQYGNECKNASQ
jgi:hypothetical protein